jgi:site-specific DNA-methyltransferase (adenine-specific)
MNKIICGTWQDELPKIADNSVDLIIIDPPYLVTKEKWDKIDQVDEVLSKELFRILKPTGNFYCWGGVGEKSQTIIKWFSIFQKDWYFKDWITWKKQRGMGNRRGWLYTREELLWFVKDNKQFTWNYEFQYSDERRKRDNGKDIIKPSQNGKFAKSINKRISNVWDDISETTFNINDKIKHFTPKPEKAIERIIKLHTKENDIVLDCFLGSGTTAVVAKRLNRQFIGIEKDNDYVVLAKERLENG